MSFWFQSFLFAACLVWGMVRCEVSWLSSYQDYSISSSISIPFVASSSDGKLVYAGIRNSFKKSSKYGAPGSWSNVTVVSSGNDGNNNCNINSVVTSGNGQYVYVFCSYIFTRGLYRSDSYGSNGSFDKVSQLGSSLVYSMSLSNDGSILSAVLTSFAPNYSNPVVVTNLDYGQNNTVWSVVWESNYPMSSAKYSPCQVLSGDGNVLYFSFSNEDPQECRFSQAQQKYICTTLSILASNGISSVTQMATSYNGSELFVMSTLYPAKFGRFNSLLNSYTPLYLPISSNISYAGISTSTSLSGDQSENDEYEDLLYITFMEDDVVQARLYISNNSGTHFTLNNITSYPSDVNGDLDLPRVFSAVAPVYNRNYSQGDNEYGSGYLVYLADKVPFNIIRGINTMSNITNTPTASPTLAPTNNGFRVNSNSMLWMLIITFFFNLVLLNC